MPDFDRPGFSTSELLRRGWTRGKSSTAAAGPSTSCCRPGATLRRQNGSFAKPWRSLIR